MNEATEKNRCQSGLSGGNHEDQSFWGGKEKGTSEIHPCGGVVLHQLFNLVWP